VTAEDPTDTDPAAAFALGNEIRAERRRVLGEAGEDGRSVSAPVAGPPGVLPGGDGRRRDAGTGRRR
jgi:hypothetical protein